MLCKKDILNLPSYLFLVGEHPYIQMLQSYLLFLIKLVLKFQGISNVSL